MHPGTALFRRRLVVLSFALPWLPWLAGCAAFHPMKGVPVRYLPDQLKVGYRSGKRTIDLSLLSQNWNGVHLVDSGDILGIYIGGVLGKVNENPQVLLSQNADFQPAAGVPVAVREDGTISLPMIGALIVRGKTIRETEDAIRDAYTNHAVGKEFLKPDQERVLVGLQRARQTRVLVVRQDSRNEPIANAAAGMLNIGTAKRGTGRVISLPAYRNDVLNALVMSEGLPGLDAQNEVYIIRRKPNATGPDEQWQDPIDPAELIRRGAKEEKPVIRGQNPTGWALQVEGQDQSPNSNGRDYGTPGIPASPSFANDGSFPQGSTNRHYSTRRFGQSGIDAPQDPGRAAYDEGRQRAGFGAGPVDRAGYQNPQPWGPPNGMPQQWNNGNPAPAPYSPTPLNNPSGQPLTTTPMPQLPQWTPQPGNSPMPQMQPQPDYSNSQGMPNWTQQQPGMTPPNSAGQFPAPGYSLPGTSPGGLNGADMNGSPPDPRGFDQTDSPPARDIGVVDGRRIIRIPIRLGPDEQIDIRKEDVILHDGDIVFIEARDTEVFFTGGLLGGGQFTLPRDFDLDILQALSIATSRTGTAGAARQIGGVSALNSDVTISPSNVVIIRKLPEGGEIPIQVDLYQARNDISERIVIQPGDYIYLQYTPMEAIGAFIDRHLLEGALFGLFTQQLNRPSN